MKLVHRILLKLFGLLMVGGGATVAAMWWDAPFRAMLLHQFRLHVWTQYGFAFGLMAVLAGLIGLLPSGRRRTHNVISFPGVHGDVTIELDSVESTLTRMVNKMPEVKKIRIRVIPAEDRRRVRVKADVLVYKGASASSARELANRITDYLTDTAVNMLGVEDVTTVDLNVRGIVVDARPVPLSKTDARAPKADEPVVEAPPAAIAEETPRAEPAIPPVCEIATPAPAVDEAIAIAEPDPDPDLSADTLEDTWTIREPQDAPVPVAAFVEDEVTVEAEPIAEAAEAPPATPDVVLPPLSVQPVATDAAEPEPEPPIEMGPIDGETKENTSQPAHEWTPPTGFRAWDDTDRSVKRLEE